jgi:NADPH2:quinone reductase
MHALVFDRFGGPDVLEYREIPDPALAPGFAVVRLRAIGLNYADIYRRSGNYHLAGEPPWILGYEGAGTIEAVDSSQPAQFRVGDRVAFADSPRANAELALVSLKRLIPLPDDISFEQAAGSLLQGLTAQFLTDDSYAVGAGDIALVHAAAGGVGSMLLQMLRAKDARAVGLVSSDAKATLARASGAEVALLYGDDWPHRALEAIAPAKGYDVVYDSIGVTLDKSLDVARKGGTVVFYGMAGGNPQPVDPRRLMDESKTLTGGDLWNVLTNHKERVRRATLLFDWIRSGALRVDVSATFKLSQGAKAHELLESRRSTGKILLIPD